jgi:hypothetical protein
MAAAREAAAAVIGPAEAARDKVMHGLDHIQQQQRQRTSPQGISRDPRLPVRGGTPPVEMLPPAPPLQQHHQQPSSASFSKGSPAPVSGGPYVPPAVPAASTAAAGAGAGAGVGGPTGSFKSPAAPGGGGTTPGVGLAAVGKMLEQSSVSQLLQRLKRVASDGKAGVLSYWPCCVPKGTCLTVMKHLR